ncbi:coiled-coil domain-containing protein [Streptomyces sp. NPDC057939]|uniref:coiled-coil domain-containing protein n=1 Tax=Streptomyces sp. NPDC057939 TaxID=3346284 RepID=UPI0036E98966
MEEIARRPGASGPVETGDVAEVVALGNVLLSLFNTLGVSQSAYAYRVHLDKSAVSRYLSGRRLAPQDFIDRLVNEVANHRGSPVTEDARIAIRAQYLSALKAVNPGRFELESLREELSRSNRAVKRARREIDALHTLLDTKEDEVRAAKAEMAELISDWSKERAGDSTASALAQKSRSPHTDATLTLMEEIKELREDLAAARKEYEAAEGRNAALKERVRNLEEELATAAEANRTQEVSVETLLSELHGFIEISKFENMSRELADAAWGRPFSDVIEVYNWCQEQTDPTTQAKFSSDVARFRPLSEVITFGEHIGNNSSPEIRQFMASLVPRLTPETLASTCEAWQYNGTRFQESGLADFLLSAAISAQPPYGIDRVVRDVRAVASRVHFAPIKECSSSLCRAAGRHESWLIGIMPALRAGWKELRSQTIGQAAYSGLNFGKSLKQLNVADLAYFLTVTSDVTNRFVDYYTPTSPVIPVGVTVADALAMEMGQGMEMLELLCREIQKAGWISTLERSAIPEVQRAIRRMGLMDHL